MLHHGHISAVKMDQLAEAFWWPGMNREIQEKAESCPSCRAAGKNITIQIPSTEKNSLEILTEPNQEIQLDFAGPIKSKSRGNVYILVAIDRFSKWPTAQICKSTDTRNVLKFLTKVSRITEHNSVLKPITAVVLKATNLNNSATAKTLNVSDALRTSTRVPA